MKRRGSRSLRLSIDSHNNLRVSLPSWVSYRTAAEFAASRKDWIIAHWQKPSLLKNNDRVGKSHRLHFVPSQGTVRVSSRMVGNEVRISYPSHLTPADTAVQAAARRGAIKALTLQAKTLLPNRLTELSDRAGFRFHSVQIKKLHSRWGSCSATQDITLNLFLMHLPWELIDYVLMHELVHTEILHHQPAFWHRLEACLPHTPELRRRIRNYKPSFSSNAYGIMDI